MTEFDEINCACVIHGDLYTIEYVNVLYNMLCRNISLPVKLHVFTEESRNIPEQYIKHNLVDWGIGGPKQSWWYKMQLFDTSLYSGPLLYFDLDVVIVNNLDWVWQLPLNNFWSIRDFKRLWHPTFYGINSSMMWWDNTKTTDIWRMFRKFPVSEIINTYHGDQDFVSKYVKPPYLRFFNESSVKSWRWECFDGGYDFKKRQHNNIGNGTVWDSSTSVMIFHGNPKPHEVDELIRKNLWK